MHYDGTLIVVSHDRDFLTGLTELVYEVTPTGLRQYIGDIQQFLVEKSAPTPSRPTRQAAADGPSKGNPWRQGHPRETKQGEEPRQSSKEDGKQAYENQKDMRQKAEKQNQQTREGNRRTGGSGSRP